MPQNVAITFTVTVQYVSKFFAALVLTYCHLMKGCVTFFLSKTIVVSFLHLMILICKIYTNEKKLKMDNFNKYFKVVPKSNLVNFWHISEVIYNRKPMKFVGTSQVYSIADNKIPFLFFYLFFFFWAKKSKISRYMLI